MGCDQMDIDLKAYAKELISERPEAILVIKKKYIDDDDWEAAVEKNPKLLAEWDDPYYASCYTAVEADGRAILDCPPDMIDYRLLERAILTTPSVAILLPRNYLTLEIRELAVDHDPTLIGSIENLPIDYIKGKLKYNPSLIRYIKNPSDELKCYAIEQNPNVALYFPKLSKAMRKVIDEKYPDFREGLANYNK